MRRYLCIHGHFYQPPRENPWLETIEVQDSAYPFHDWNERITSECYEPNAFSRILDSDGYISQLTNNYARISFNFGPTLLSWLERCSPNVYQALLDADKESRKRFDGHGSAVAQVYNHIIMPLANYRDKVTQIRWGIADFRSRFGRDPEGMWLAETAVDIETLSLLAEHGIRYTILSPYQASRVRMRPNGSWEDATGAKIDPTTPYVQSLPNGKKIALFFYDAPISQGIAFEGVLKRGEDFAQRLLGAFSTERDWPQIVHIATDGETYGHHHRFGDMALAYALQYIEDRADVQLTNYGQYLALHERLPEVEILERTAWSCAHGVGRWKEDCGCNTGRGGTHQKWRKPLRDALDWVRDRFISQSEKVAKGLLKDLWTARDRYIDVILNRSDETIQEFIAENATRPLSHDETGQVLKLMELQRHTQLMYTSCGWFFDEISGIETVQIMQYAERAIQIAEDLFGDTEASNGFQQRLAKAPSNDPDLVDGGRIYQEQVVPTRVSLKTVAAHHAAASMFQEMPDCDCPDPIDITEENPSEIDAYIVDREEYHQRSSGRSRTSWGRLKVASRLTYDSQTLTFACFHIGEQNLVGGVRLAEAEADCKLESQLKQAVARADVPRIIRLIQSAFPENQFSLRNLFRDEQRRILDRLLGQSLRSIEEMNRHTFHSFDPLIHFLTEQAVPVPAAFRAVADIVINAEIRTALKTQPEAEHIERLIDKASTWQTRLDRLGLAAELEDRIALAMQLLENSPTDGEAFDRLDSVIDLARGLPFEVNLTSVQNRYFQFLTRQRSLPGDAASGSSLKPEFSSLAEKLSLRVPQ
ncbi:DUF3536 domain-containing protein [Thalassoroseus pseudoceratinae]|uniref:DUF3536 domain-containing protein n=1 Tax=Thalassoroseus pseudoceratinae TaxID=2713176 RepID=UPI00141DF295|nr:DUF3536 domain-containing protein [Thalassoroseus pseudoceratinae]